MKNFSEKLRKNYIHWLILAVLAVSFFIGASWYNYSTQKNDFIKWASPDETANYTFTKLYAQEGRISFFEKYNLYSGEIIHPRSVRSDAGWLKPVSFLGIILFYGKIASVFGYKIIPYLTPLFAAIGIFYFYFLIKKIFSKTNALISACLLASLPPYIYYSARSMFHNVLFVVLLIIGLYCLIADSGKEFGGQTSGTRGLTSAPFHLCFRGLSSFFCRLINPALAGIFIGLAIITRTSELLWLAPALIVLWIFNIRKFGLANLLIFLSFLGLAILPALYWNTILFGSPLQSGYPEMNRSIYNIVSAGSAAVSSSADAPDKNELISKIKNNIFYFGIHPKYSLQMFNHYFVRMFYWIFWPAAAGLALAILPSFSSGLKALAFIFLRRLKPSGPGLKAGRRRLWIYLLCSAIMSIILLFYYGSWEFHDNPDPNQYTIGNSYTRYWLPIYLAAIPFAALAIETVARPFRKLFYKPLEQVSDLRLCGKIANLQTRAPRLEPLESRDLGIPPATLQEGGERLQTRGSETRLEQSTLEQVSDLRFSRKIANLQTRAVPRPRLEPLENKQKFVPPQFPEGDCGVQQQIRKNHQKFLSLAVRQGMIAAGIGTIIISAVFFVSLQFVLFGSDEGLVYAVGKNLPSRIEYEKILALTESNSVIITRYHDKLFFPERKVIVGLFDDDNMIREYANAAKYIPVYYYNFTLPPRDIAYLNSRRLPAFGLKIKEVEKVNGDFSLYKLIPLK